MDPIRLRARTRAGRVRPAAPADGGCAGSDYSRAMNDGRLGRRIARLFVPYRPQLASIMAIIVVTSGLSVISALLVRQVFDEALFPKGGGGVDLDRLYPLVAVLV